MATPYDRERQIAELAVQRATILTRKVLSLVNKGELAKTDDTPVSLADFGAQALIVAAIHGAFPEDSILGEETADALRENTALLDQVWQLISDTTLDDNESEKLLGRPQHKEEALKMIDLGGNTTESGKGRVWTIDPVDGTKTFLDGTQYAVVASLIVDGIDQLGVIALPKLDLGSGRCSEDDVATNGPGYILSGIRGHGVQLRQMGTGALCPAIPVRSLKPKTNMKGLVYAENVAKAKTNFPERQKFATKLGAPWPAVNLYSSHVTYAALALGMVDYQIRAPHPTQSPSCVWDHAGAILILEEVGGKVTDLRGNPIDLSVGRRLKNNYGNVAAAESIHGKVWQMVRDLFAEFPEYANA